MTRERKKQRENNSLLAFHQKIGFCIRFNSVARSLLLLFCCPSVSAFGRFSSYYLSNRVLSVGRQKKNFFTLIWKQRGGAQKHKPIQKQNYQRVESPSATTRHPGNQAGGNQARGNQLEKKSVFSLPCDSHSGKIHNFYCDNFSGPEKNPKRKESPEPLECMNESCSVHRLDGCLFLLSKMRRNCNRNAIFHSYHVTRTHSNMKRWEIHEHASM